MTPADDAPRVLLVEDDATLRAFLADNLVADGFELLQAGTMSDAIRLLEYKRPDLALIDLALPDGSGLDLIATVREADGIASRLDPSLPLVVLTGRTTEIDRIRGFEKGADDYVSKPFSYGELRLRMRAVLRRTQRRRVGGRVRVGALELDPASREVRLRGELVPLAQKEFALLRALAAEPTTVFSKDQLLRDVWGFRSLGTSRRLAPQRSLASCVALSSSSQWSSAPPSRPLSRRLACRSASRTTTRWCRPDRTPRRPTCVALMISAPPGCAYP